MPSQPPPVLVVFLLGSAGLAFFLASWAWQCRRTAGAIEMALLMMAVAVYSLGYSFEVSRYDLPGMLAAIRFEYLGSPFITPLFLAFAWRYTRQRPLPRAIAVLLLLQACFTMILVWSPFVDSLFYRNLHVDEPPPFPTIAFQPGPGFLINYYMLQAEGAAGILLLIINAVRADPMRRKQSLVIAAGGLFPLAVTIAFILRLTPERIDITPIALACTGLVCSIALFRLGVLEIVPAARGLAIDSLKDGFIVTDTKGRIQDANASARQILSRELLPGMKFVTDPAEPEASLEPVFQLLAAGTGSVDFVKSSPDGTVRYITASAQPVMEKGRRRGTVLLLHDFTKMAMLMANLQDYAEHDSLTGLLNRRYFLERGQLAIETARREHHPLGAIMVDLDHFKLINDTHGHAAGDAIIVEASRRLAAAMRSVDLVGRYGGEEFVMIVPGSDADAVFMAAERARIALAASPLECGGLVIPLTASFGTSHLFEDGSDTLYALLSRADAGLYAAKQAGRNRVVASP